MFQLYFPQLLSFRPHFPASPEAPQGPKYWTRESALGQGPKWIRGGNFVIFLVAILTRARGADSLGAQ
jgi:hypothetical protein